MSKKSKSGKGEVKDYIKMKKEKTPKPPKRLLTVTGVKRTKSTGDWVGDMSLQHQEDQEDIQKANKKAARNPRRIQARQKVKRLKYAKPDSTVTQKNLTAQWAFPVARLEEFLRLFHQAVYDMAVRRLSDTEPVENPKGGEALQEGAVARVGDSRCSG